MLLTAITGSETWQGWSAKVHLFHSPRRGQGREVHIGIAARDPANNISYAQQGTAALARPGMRAELGQWTNSTFDVPEGEVFKLFAQRSSGPVRQANMFLQTRGEAALQRVVVRLSTHPQAAYSAVHIQGRFDLLSWEQARDMGIVVLPQFRPHFEPSVASRMFEVQVVEQAIRARPVVENRVVETTSGEEVIVPTRRRGRALKL